uniref:Putative ovule protein n=1 Tax=Solanum chacoense TaxID=4108 RepID=A0A0V0GQI6_SOLCH
MTSAESEEHEKLLTQVQLAQVMQMLQQVKNKDQVNNSNVIASINCACITLAPNHFSLNSNTDEKQN